MIPVRVDRYLARCPRTERNALHGRNEILTCTQTIGLSSLAGLKHHDQAAGPDSIVAQRLLPLREKAEDRGTDAAIFQVGREPPDQPGLSLARERPGAETKP
jgi:hypothetical protein